MLRIVIAAWAFGVSLKAVEEKGENRLQHRIGHKVPTVRTVLASMGWRSLRKVNTMCGSEGYGSPSSKTWSCINHQCCVSVRMLVVAYEKAILGLVG